MKPNSHSASAFALHRLACCVVLFLAVTTQAAWAQAPADIEATVKRMLAATETRSRDAFVAQGDAAFQADIAPAKFNELSAQFAPRVKQGYTMTFVTQLRQQGYAVYVWKLEFKDGGDDVLLTLAVKGGKVGGLTLQ